MSDQVAVALIGAVGLVLVALISHQGVQLGRIRRDARAVRGQLDNDHTENPDKTGNIREDIDEKHVTVIDRISDIGRDIGGIRHELRLLRQDLSGTQDRVLVLETTQDRERFIREHHTPHQPE